jgi:hypothetical protein
MLYVIIFVDSVVIAGGLVMLGCLVVDEVVAWRNRRRKASIQRVERELAQTQRSLEALAMRHDVWLQAQAHEARKALILESFLASQEARNSPNHLQRRG